MTNTASKLGTGRNDGSSVAENDAAATSLDQPDDTAADPEEDDLVAARAQLRARAGAKGRRSSRPGRGVGGQGQVKAVVCVSREGCASLRLDFMTATACDWNCRKNGAVLSDVDTSGFSCFLVRAPCHPEAAVVPATATRGQERKTGEKRNGLA